MRNKVDKNHVIDFHRALEDDNDFRKFKNGYDSGDHLHPNIDAYKKSSVASENTTKERYKYTLKYKFLFHYRIKISFHCF